MKSSRININVTWLFKSVLVNISCACFILLITACETIEVDSPDFQLSSKTVFEEDATAESAVLGIYSNMMLSEGFVSGSFQSITTLAGLSADDLTDYSFNPTQRQFFENSLLPTNPTLEFSLWNEGYRYIYHTNAIMEGLASSEGISDEVKQRLRGEALFIRAFCYFHLVNLFGDIPLAIGTDYEVNANLSTSSTIEIYELIIQDLMTAAELLPVDYLFAGGERIRPNKWAATALLARVNLYQENWQAAEALSSQVINQQDMYSLQELNSVFLANSMEAIWQLKPVSPNINTKEGRMFILLFNPFHVSLSDNLVSSFEGDDLRREYWVDSLQTDQTYYYPAKYKVRFGTPVIEYSMVLRLAEQYLIRAEARVMQGNLQGSLQDLNFIRIRAGLEPLDLIDSSEVLEAIEEERRHELFTERGHRWYDLKRTGRASEVLAPIKEQWQETDVLYPIPQNEISKNPNLDQNNGY